MTPPDLTTCEREPIHRCGAIQPYGVLLGLREPDLAIRVVSANTLPRLGRAPDALLGEPVASALGEKPARRLAAVLTDPRAVGADPLELSVPDGTAYELTWYRTQGLVVAELEPVEATGLRAGLPVFAEVRQALDALQVTTSVRQLCETSADEVRRLTGYDRVMVYRFSPDGHGEVVAEAADPELSPFLGLSYPASDIPRQARRLYLLNQLRLIADVGYEPVPLLGAPGLDAADLDLSLSGLRSVSPVHVEYLRTMGVGASLSISLIQGTGLWGLIACHHRTPRRIDAQLRAACRLVGQVFSVRLSHHELHERSEHAKRLGELRWQLFARLTSAGSLADTLVSADPSPLALTDADGMVARVEGRLVTLGVVPPEDVVTALLARLRAPDESEVLVCADLPHRYPEFAECAKNASGVLAVPLSPAYEDFILWFRGELVHDVVWAGDPDKPVVTYRPGPEQDPGVPRLGPRRSFEARREEVRGTSVAWHEAEVDTARALAAAMPALLSARARDRLAQQAMHDPLTGLANRDLLLDRAGQALARSERTGGQVALIAIDLDRFRIVNDSRGHDAGDDLLRQAARRLEGVIRDTDTAARTAGDEFVLLCEGVTPQQAGRLCARVLEAFRQPFSVAGGELLVTASVGLVVAGSGAQPSGLLRDADIAMYRAKHGGRDAFAAFTPEMRDASLRRTQIEASLRPAILHRELDLHFQPIFRIDGRLRGFEALARWPMPGRGMIPPTEFIPIAEASGLIGSLTEWVLEEALAALAGWRTTRPDLDLTVSVNITASQMADDRLDRAVDAALGGAGLGADALCLEITESALVSDTDRTQVFLRGLVQKGVRLSIDDFGTGFSSLAYLSHLPVHELKIDRAFLAGLPTRRSDVAVVASVVALAHQLGLQALAEGVSTEEQLAVIRRLGCDSLQGFLLGRPMATHDVASCLAVL